MRKGSKASPELRKKLSEIFKATYTNGGRKKRSKESYRRSAATLKATHARDNGHHARILGQVKIDYVTGCHIWTGYADKAGYGYVQIKRKRIGVHRYMWEKKNGPIPAGLIACHKCDTPACCNPEHIFLGTVLDNSRDMVSKKRNKFGEKHPNAKLKQSDIPRIKQLRKEGMTQQEIGNIVGVKQSVVSKILLGQIWRH